MLVYKKQHIAWTAERLIKKIISYVLLFPILLVLYPLTSLGNWLGKFYYSWR